MLPASDPPDSPAAAAAAGSPLRFPDFRVLAASSVLTGMAFIGETVVLGWLLLERSDSPLIVGVGIALRALPNLLVGLPGGALADRLDRRALLRWASLASAGVALGLALLAFAGVLASWQLLLLTFIGGAIRAVGQTARQSYVFDITGAGQVVSGLAFLTLGQRLGGITSSLALGAVLSEWGAGEAYAIVAVCNLLASAMLLLARTGGQAAPVTRPPVVDGLREFAAELRRNRLLGILVGLTAAVEVLGFSHQAVLPSLARDVLEAGPEGLGWLNAAASAGGIVAMLGLTLRGQPQRQGLTFLVVLLGFGSALVLLGASTSLVMALVTVGFVSAFASLSDLLTQSLLQSAVPNDLRGRAMGSWLLAIGLGPLGHVQIGALAAAGGVTLALATNGLLLAALGAAALLLATQVRRL